MHFDIFISAKWTDWNWRIYCFHFCVSVCLWALIPVFNSDMREKLIIFPYGQYIIETYVLLAFWRYNQVHDRSGVLGEMYKNVTVISLKMYFPQHSMQWRRRCHSWLVGTLCHKGVIHWSIRTRQSDLGLYKTMLPGPSSICYCLLFI